MTASNFIKFIFLLHVIGALASIQEFKNSVDDRKKHLIEWIYGNLEIKSNVTMSHNETNPNDDHMNNTKNVTKYFKPNYSM